MPVNMTKSWSLIIVNECQKQYSFIDPTGRTRENEYFNLVLNYLQFHMNVHKKPLIPREWTVVKNRYRKICDEASSGVYILKYALFEIHPTQELRMCGMAEERHGIGLELLRKSEVMKHLCVMCGRDERWFGGSQKIGNMVQCNTCRRWVHVEQCLDYRHLPLSEIKRHDFIFTCIICQEFTRQ